MFRIGEFSRLGCVTIDTLRHYDALALLTPAHVDPSTGYRYYSAQQLQPLNRILALKEVGFSLEEVARILRDNLSGDELRGMLKAQLVLTESALESAKLRREGILARLNYLNLEENMPEYEVTLKAVEPLTVTALREVVPTLEQVPQRIGEMFQALAGWMSANNLPFGLPMTIYHNESYTREQIDVECVIPIPDMAIDDVVKPHSPLVVRQTGSFPDMASTIVTDNTPASFKLAYNALGRWIEMHRYHITCAPREVYYTLPDAKEFTAEVQFPVGMEVG